MGGFRRFRLALDDDSAPRDVTTPDPMLKSSVAPESSQSPPFDEPGDEHEAGLP